MVGGVVNYYFSSKRLNIYIRIGININFFISRGGTKGDRPTGDFVAPRALWVMPLLGGVPTWSLATKIYKKSLKILTKAIAKLT